MLGQHLAPLSSRPSAALQRLKVVGVAVAVQPQVDSPPANAQAAQVVEINTLGGEEPRQELDGTRPRPCILVIVIILLSRRDLIDAMPAGPIVLSGIDNIAIALEDAARDFSEVGLQGQAIIAAVRVATRRKPATHAGNIARLGIGCAGGNVVLASTLIAPGKANAMAPGEADRGRVERTEEAARCLVEVTTNADGYAQLLRGASHPGRDVRGTVVAAWWLAVDNPLKLAGANVAYAGLKLQNTGMAGRYPRCTAGLAGR